MLKKNNGSKRTQKELKASRSRCPEVIRWLADHADYRDVLLAKANDSSTLDDIEALNHVDWENYSDHDCECDCLICIDTEELELPSGVTFSPSGTGIPDGALCVHDDLAEDYVFPETIVLSPEQFDWLTDLIENPRPPTQALIDLLKKKS